MPSVVCRVARPCRVTLLQMVVTDQIDYKKFLNAFNVEFQRGGGKSAITSSVVNQLYSNRPQLVALFRVLDVNRDGNLTLDEFKAACELLNARCEAQAVAWWAKYPPGGGWVGGVGQRPKKSLCT